jgi:hypothetical protein
MCAWVGACICKSGAAHLQRVQQERVRWTAVAAQRCVLFGARGAHRAVGLADLEGTTMPWFF